MPGQGLMEKWCRYEMNTEENSAGSYSRNTDIKLILVHHNAYKSTLVFAI